MTDVISYKETSVQPKIDGRTGYANVTFLL